MVFDGGDAAAWSQRTQHFGRLVPIRRAGFPLLTMEFAQSFGEDADVRAHRKRLRELWGDLDYTFPILDVLDVDDHLFLLRYAAIHWGRPRIDASNVKIAARWLVELADVYKLLLEDVPDDIDVFSAPAVHVDLDDHLRIAFTPYSTTLKPRDERAVVELVGKLFGDLVTNIVGSPFESIHRRCVDATPTRRWSSLAELIANVETLGGSADKLRARDDLSAWRAVEEGLGWMQLGYLDRATSNFERALRSPRYEPLARWGLERAGIRRPPPRAPGARSFQALELPSEPIRTTDETIELAQQSLHAGDTGYAGVLASQVLAREPDNVKAMAIIVQAHLRIRHYDRALKQIEKMKDSGTAQYLRGKALLGIGRLHEARDAFDRAMALDPKLLEAMLLRREADRLIRVSRNVVGEHKDAELDIPASLSELRAVLMSGDIAQAIAALSAHPYRAQPEAQLLLARLVAFAGAPERALVIYDEAAASEPHRFAALLGKATLLIDSAAESAVAIFDALYAEHPNDADVSEGRARALEKLGRLGEAAAEFRRFISLATGRSDVRVRAAADWLRDHPL